MPMTRPQAGARGTQGGCAAAGEQQERIGGIRDGLNRSPERSADAGVGAGEFSPLENAFWKTAPRWVDGY